MVIIMLLLVALIGLTFFFIKTKGRLNLGSKDKSIVADDPKQNNSMGDNDLKQNNNTDYDLKKGYEKALEISDSKNNFQLNGIIVSVNEAESNISYFLVTDKEIVEANYYPAGDRAIIINSQNKKPVGTSDGKQSDLMPSLVDNGNPVVPENVLTLRPKDIQDVLSDNDDYNRYKQAYPDLFKGYTASLRYYADDLTWKWNVHFQQIDSQDQNKITRSLDFLVDMNKKTVSVVDKINID